MKKPVEFSFEAENEEKRNRDNRKNNVLKRYGVNNTDEVFYVGSLDLIDPHSGKHVYVPTDKNCPKEPEYDDIPDSDMLEAVETVEETSSSDMSSEDLDLANEIYARLMAEAAADEAAIVAEIEALKAEQEAIEAASVAPSDADYNAETGSYSGLYGKKPMSESESDILASIMNTNSSYTKSIDDLIAENQG